MRRLGLLLCLVLVARAGDDPAAPVVRIHDVADLKDEGAWWAAAFARVRVVAQGAKVELQNNNIVVVAPVAVQEKIAKELSVVREAFGTLLHLDLRVLKIEGGLDVASLPLEKLEGLVKEKRAEVLAAPSLVCHNGQDVSVSVLKQISYLSDFDVTLDGQGNVTADPVVATLQDGVTANLRPLLVGQEIRVAADISVTEVAGQMTEVELPLPLPIPVKVQVPESTTRSVRKLVACKPGAYAVIDLGGGQAVLIRATRLQEEECQPGAEQGNQEIPLR